MSDTAIYWSAVGVMLMTAGGVMIAARFTRDKDE